MSNFRNIINSLSFVLFVLIALGGYFVISNIQTKYNETDKRVKQTEVETKATMTKLSEINQFINGSASCSFQLFVTNTSFYHHWLERTKDEDLKIGVGIIPMEDKARLLQAVKNNEKNVVARSNFMFVGENIGTMNHDISPTAFESAFQSKYGNTVMIESITDVIAFPSNGIFANDMVITPRGKTATVMGVPFAGTNNPYVRVTVFFTAKYKILL